MALDLGLSFLLSTFLGGLMGGGGEEQEIPQSYGAKRWATQMARQYPEMYGFPQGQTDIMGQRLTEMLGGQLSPAVQKYLTYKYQQAWESALPGYADIGAGPGTLASGRIKLGEQQAIQGAYMGQEQIAQAMGLMPQYTQMMLSPYMADVSKWQNVSEMWRTTPGAPFLKEGQKGRF